MFSLRGLQYRRTIVGPDVEIQGDFTSQGLVKIRGSVKGNLWVKGKVVICEEANCMSNIAADSLEIAGRVHGDVRADKLVLRPTGILYGRATCRRQVIHKGGVIIPTGSGLIPEAPASADPRVCDSPDEGVQDGHESYSRYCEGRKRCLDTSESQHKRRSQGDRTTIAETTIESSARPEGARGPVFRTRQPKEQTFVVSF